MRTFVVVPGSALDVVSLDTVKAHLKVEHDDEDDLIAAYLQAAVAHIDGPTGWLGRAVTLQTLEARFDHFGCGCVRLPYPPLVEVVSVKYLDSDGIEQVIAAEGYVIAGELLEPAFGTTWPVPRWQREAVRVRYRAGYAEGAVPPAIRAAVLIMVGDLYRNRESTSDGAAVAVQMPVTADALLGPLRVWA